MKKNTFAIQILFCALCIISNPLLAKIHYFKCTVSFGTHFAPRDTINIYKWKEEDCTGTNPKSCECAQEKGCYNDAVFERAKQIYRQKYTKDQIPPEAIQWAKKALSIIKNRLDMGQRVGMWDGAFYEDLKNADDNQIKQYLFDVAVSPFGHRRECPWGKSKGKSKEDILKEDPTAEAEKRFIEPEYEKVQAKPIEVGGV